LASVSRLDVRANLVYGFLTTSATLKLRSPAAM
jgi:hypothetical protein